MLIPSVLAADIGGTKTIFKLVEGNNLIAERRFENKRFADFEGLLAAFLGGLSGAPQAACLAVAGPVVNDEVRMTNLGWHIRASSVASRFGIPQVRVVNDFAAVGYGLDALEDVDLAVIQPGAVVSRAPRVALGAGTGLGVCPIVWCADGYAPVNSEGGHVSFAPWDEDSRGLVRFLAARHGRVSAERVVSGPGLAAIAAYLGGVDTGASSTTGTGSDPDPAHVAALCATDRGAQRSVALFSRAFGAVAGDLALTLMARGGVFVAGGVAAKLPRELFATNFLAGFLDKGRYAKTMEGFPVHLVLNDEVGLLGAERVAASLVAQGRSA